MSVVKGWCPGALRPMESGDGWVVRIRPPGGRVTQAQGRAIAQGAHLHGNCRIDLTGRANLQIRGVTPRTHAPLMDALRALSLIDADIATESRRNIIVTPFADAQSDRLAQALETALARSDLTLPSKFGFAVDCGPAPVLSATPADIRIERTADGRLILRADGMEQGAALTGPQDAVALARWFLDQGGAPDGRGRMAALITRGLCPEGACLPPAQPATLPVPGVTAHGALVAAEFGQLEAATLQALADLGPIRLTPWRMVLIEGLDTLPDLQGLIVDPTDPRLRLRACPGAPACPQGQAATRPLARSLAPHVPPGRVLHVSGCAKGCGWPHAAWTTLTATPDGFDLVRNGRAGDRAVKTALSPAELPKVI